VFTVVSVYTTSSTSMPSTYVGELVVVRDVLGHDLLEVDGAELRLPDGGQRERMRGRRVERLGRVVVLRAHVAGEWGRVTNLRRHVEQLLAQERHELRLHLRHVARHRLRAHFVTFLFRGKWEREGEFLASLCVWLARARKRARSPNGPGVV